MIVNVDPDRLAKIAYTAWWHSMESDLGGEHTSADTTFEWSILDEELKVDWRRAAEAVRAAVVQDVADGAIWPTP